MRCPTCCSYSSTRRYISAVGGPGQLVGYPFIRIDDVVAYVRTLENALVTALAGEGLVARSRPQEGHRYTGVWVGERKIASIGVHWARRVTTHGFAVNVENDLEPFSWIVPSGLDGVQMTSLLRETVVSAGMKCFRRRAAHELARALGCRQRLVSRSRQARHCRLHDLGDTCTRGCGFCNVKTGKPTWNDPLEPAHVARRVARTALRHAVTTSVERDDLPDR
jgi:lipoate-protein ligase B